MRFKIEFHPDFYFDIEQAVNWYNEQQKGLGDKFLLCVKKRVAELKNSALNFAIRYDDIHCLPLRKFPYMIHYNIDLERKSVKVIALFHTSRDPELWETRAKE
jgi:ParE toxin of type II toxin-antitoxin system, parDE